MANTPYSTHVPNVSSRQTPQSAPIPGEPQVENRAGGYVYELDDFASLERFLILGSEGSTYYASEQEMTVENMKTAQRCLDIDGIRTINKVIEISEAGRAPKNDPAIAVMALAAAHKDVDTKKYALVNLHRVCRIGTHLFTFADIVNKLRGWGRTLTSGIKDWYLKKPVSALALQLIKYQQRNGWSHRDLLRLSHPKSDNSGIQKLFAWTTHGTVPETFEPELSLLDGFVKAQNVDNANDLITLISQHKLQREMIPTEYQNNPEVWKALLPNLGLTAILRNLANMTRYGVIPNCSKSTQFIIDKLTDVNEIKKAKLHPMNIFIALKTYEAGRGLRGQNTWTPEPKIIAALNTAFYNAFSQVEPTGKHILLGIDISGSMWGGYVMGIPGFTPAEAAAVMAMTTVRTEPNHTIMAFQTKFVPLKIHAQMSLNEVVDVMHKASYDMGGTDCAQPMLYALERYNADNNFQPDAFGVYTDNETWAGSIHPIQALDQYCNKTGKVAKLIVQAFTPTRNTIVPDDLRCLDVAGLDSAVPQLIHDFIKA